MPGAAHAESGAPHVLQWVAIGAFKFPQYSHFGKAARAAAIPPDPTGPPTAPAGGGGAVSFARLTAAAHPSGSLVRKKIER